MKIYRHYKGGLYIELCRGLLEPSLERGDGSYQVMVTYQSVWNKTNYVRPADEFDGPVVMDDENGGQKREKRFQYIGDTP